MRSSPVAAGKFTSSAPTATPLGLPIPRASRHRCANSATAAPPRTDPAARRGKAGVLRSHTDLSSSRTCPLVRPMHQVVYSSAAIAPFSETQLTELLARARMNNARLGVSGMLLYHEGSFLQVLEGEASPLESLFISISADKRHHRVIALLKREVDERHFGDWRMGFASTKNLPANLPGYSDYLRLRGDPVESAHAAVRLMAAFRDGRFHSFVQR
jgi:Sensors of blue-light using FAD